MPSLNRNEKVTCENCGVQVTKLKLARHKKRCSAGTLYCTQCPNFSTLSQDDLNYHIAKQHSAAGPSKTYKCNLCHAEFPGFYALRQHKNTQHGKQIGFGASNIDVEDIMRDVDDQSLREELQSCRDISWLILNYIKEDMVYSILLSTTLQLRLSKKNWIVFWIN